jgi:hypothetical protein
MTFRWDKFSSLCRKIDEQIVYDHTVQVVQQNVTYNSDDLFRIPNNITSGAYNVPCHFEYGMRENYQRLPGGMAAGATGFLECGAEWESTFKKNRAFVIYDSTNYEIVRLDKSTFEDELIVHLKKK